MIRKIILTIVISALISPLVLGFQIPQAQAGIQQTNAAASAAAQATAVNGAAGTGAAAINSAAGLAAINVPVFDPVNAAGWNAYLGVETAKANANQMQQLHQSWKDMLLSVIKKEILDVMVDQITGWIQGGGEPKFITDWQGFLNDAFQAGVGDIIQQTNLAFLCAPFSLQVRLSLLPVKPFSQRVTCTLNDIIANIEDFYNNFSNGSWIAYEYSWWPENNYYGTLIMAYDEMMFRGAQQKEAAQNQALAYNGWLPTTNAYNLITVPGNLVGQMAGKVFGDWQINGLLNATDLEQYATAIGNAAINRLVVEGVSGIQGLSKTATQDNLNEVSNVYQNAVTEQFSAQKVQMLDDYQEIIDYEQNILNYKKQSLFNSQTYLAALNTLKTRNCQPPVSDSDISTAQSEVNRLTAETSNIQSFVDQANSNLNELFESKYTTQRETALLQGKYDQFIQQYSMYYGDMFSGATLRVAQDEDNTKQTQVSSVQARLNLCVTTATSTNP